MLELRATRLLMKLQLRRDAAELISIYYEDWYPVLHQKFVDQWNSTWPVSGNKLHEVKESIQRWKLVKSITRREEIIINRIRTGHSLITHSYLMDDAVLPVPPICPLCNDAILTIKHVLIDCNVLARERNDSDAYRTANVINMSYLLPDETIKVKPFLNLSPTLVFLPKFKIDYLTVLIKIVSFIFVNLLRNLLLMLYIDMCMLLMKSTMVLEYIIDTM